MHLLLDYRMDIVEQRMATLQAEMSMAGNDMQRLTKIMTEYHELQTTRNRIARELGANIIV